MCTATPKIMGPRSSVLGTQRRAERQAHSEQTTHQPPARPGPSLLRCLPEEGRLAGLRAHGHGAIRAFSTYRDFPPTICGAVSWLRCSFPLTAAGQLRICTGFPLGRVSNIDTSHQRQPEHSRVYRSLASVKEHLPRERTFYNGCRSTHFRALSAVWRVVR